MNTKVWLSISILIILLSACSAAPEIKPSFDPAQLKFDGQKAFAIETELVNRFPDRASGYPNNHLAAQWILERMSAAGWSCSMDEWQIVNYSPSGFMCIKRETDGKTRVVHNQLLAVRRGGGAHFQLGLVQWLRLEVDGRLRCGVRLFPGVPQAISVRPSNFNPVGGGRYERALLLPEIPAPSTAASLVLPAGWFQTGRFVEVYSDRKQVAKLLNLLEKGSDFDRGTVLVI